MLISTIKNSETHDHGLTATVTPQENAADGRMSKIDWVKLATLS